MTLDEAIEHARRVARTCDDAQCAADNERLAEWLTVAKMARESAFVQIPQMAQTIHENHELREENTKLRELVRCLVYATNSLDRATLIANAAELGIEVQP